jgi:hypothetical protein
MYAASRRLGFGRLGHGFAIPTPPSPTLPAPHKAMLRIALWGAGNVINSQNVMQHFGWNLFENILYIDKIII